MTVERLVRETGLRPERIVTALERRFPVAKGFGTSTADICAAAASVGAACGRELTPGELADLALDIEPSDGIMFEGLAIFDHRKGNWIKALSEPPEMDVLVIDCCGSEIDTIEFNRTARLDELNDTKEPLVKEAVSMLLAGVQNRDPALIGEAASLSAQAHQAILPKPQLERLIEISNEREVGAYGVVVAHSGTVAGILLPPGSGAGSAPELDRLTAAIKLDNLGRVMGVFKVCGGGIRLHWNEASGRENQAPRREREGESNCTGLQGATQSQSMTTEVTSGSRPDCSAAR